MPSNEQIVGPFILVTMQALFTLFIWNSIFLYDFFFLWKLTKCFFVCNDFVNAKHGFHHFKCAKKIYCIFRIRFEHFMHDIFLIMHNHLIIFLSTTHTFNKN